MVKTESETNSKEKQCISSRSRRKLIHDPYISTKLMKGRRQEMYFRNIPEI